MGRGGGLAPALISSWRRHPAQPREDPDQALREIDLAKLRHLLAKLSLPLLGPGDEKGLALDVREAAGNLVGHHLDHAMQPGTSDRHERVAEVERDGRDPLER